jgi:hypothetical protein
MSNTTGYWFTVGKIYHLEKCDGITKFRNTENSLVSTQGDCYLITNDIGHQHFLFEDELKKDFINLAAVREFKIDLILKK